MDDIMMKEMTLTNVEISETAFQVDYKENLATAFKMMEEIEMSLDKDIHNELHQALSKVDRGISDVEHFIEFLNFNASQGYMFSKMIQELTRARRKIKERIDERNRLMSFIHTYRKMFKQPLKQQLGQQEYRQTALESQKYQIRELSHLQPYFKVIEEQKAKMKAQKEEEAYLAYQQDVEYVSLAQA
ncbi:hypothetical protein PQE74_gp069 [Bacillus phage vB_BanS_Chewbecca]|uniref:Uncharacterized protein n=4 Tax=Caudoviricetes TaxID=2731619 RepID=A0AAE8YWT1_9CAUD|nr:hypothetical protein PQE72_gp095 [Bacillus phage vB_BanS_Skywalker]YP_010681212.1 hypothetical protein PQE74_gp069 [Bacillus phage vB_BanS_Chewbecca]UGO46152.1 hypothetical protein CHEWBECCA_69 [Bacillus phage vB_BanS_Chewbecca]UGO51348.1 hypothetical protein SKYWALKER_191 [Bacillus phage vB_BanS_Skywalker]